MEDLAETVFPDFQEESAASGVVLENYLQVSALCLDADTLTALGYKDIRSIGDLLDLSPGILAFKYNFTTSQIAAIQKELEGIEATVLPPRWRFWGTRRIIERVEREIWAFESFQYVPPEIEQSVWNRFVHRVTSGKHYKKPRYRRRL